MNSAFVFIKPHAVTEKAKALVKAGLAAANINVSRRFGLGVAAADLSSSKKKRGSSK